MLLKDHIFNASMRLNFYPQAKKTTFPELLTKKISIPTPNEWVHLKCDLKFDQIKPNYPGFQTITSY